MFERYTERARRVIFFARYEASKLGSTTIETEHLLLGLIREDKNLTIHFICNSAAIESIRQEIEGRTTIREKVSTSIDLPLSNECKRILAYAAEEADRMQHRHLGTEHLLLGILREEKCVAAEVLMGRGLRLDAIREELARSAKDMEGRRLDAIPEFELTRPQEEVMVPDGATAKQIAEAVWFPLYGVETVAGQQTWDASLLDASLVRFRVWRVSAGPLFAFIRMTDGKILAMGKSEDANV